MAEVPNSMNQVENLPDEIEWDDSPPNTQMQIIDIATWQNAKFMCMRCGLLLTEGLAGHCPRCD